MTVDSKKALEEGVKFFPGSGWHIIYAGDVCARRLRSKPEADTYLMRVKSGLARYEHVSSNPRFDEGRPDPR